MEGRSGISFPGGLEELEVLEVLEERTFVIRVLNWNFKKLSR